MPKLNEEQLRFFMNEVLGLFEWSEEEEESDIDPLEFVKDKIKKSACKHVNTRIINWNKYCEDCDTWL